MTEPAGRLDASGDGVFVVAVGRKGSGKSVLTRRLFDGYPYDKLVVDINGDIELPDGTVELSGPPPMRLPLPNAEGDPQVFRYVPDASSPTWIDDMDRVVGLCYHHGRMVVWVDEMGVLTTANASPPNTRRALHTGRHARLSMLNCMPRPIAVDPLVMSQADYVYIFDLPNPADRKRVANVVGFPPAEMDAAVAALPEFGYLRWDARAKEMAQFPPLPLRLREPSPPPGRRL